MNGMDEISLSGETLVGELKNGEVREYVVHPSDFGLPVYDSRALKVADTTESVRCIQRALANEDGPVRDVVLLNAGAALYCAGVAGSVAEGVKHAREVVASGAAAPSSSSSSRSRSATSRRAEPQLKSSCRRSWSSKRELQRAMMSWFVRMPSSVMAAYSNSTTGEPLECGQRFAPAPAASEQASKQGRVGPH